MPTPPNKAPKDGPPVRGSTTRNCSRASLLSHCVRKKVKKSPVEHFSRKMRCCKDRGLEARGL